MDKSPDKTKELPDPWSWTDYDFTNHLRAELGKGHILFDKNFTTIARRHDRDDFLFELANNKFAFVHLAFTGKPHSDKRWPATKIYESWQEVFVNLIKADSEGWE
jgi:hypothetical protein